MKRFFLTLAALCMICSAASAQSVLERMKSRAKNAAEQNIGNKVEQSVNDLLNGKKTNKQQAEEDKADEDNAEAKSASWTCPECGTEGNTGKFCMECGAKKPGDEAAKPKKSTASNYAKSDFVPGDEIIFEDSFENERMGEFPSQWDLMDGYAEVGEGSHEPIATNSTDEGRAKNRRVEFVKK